jgi:hypothetical protein
MKRLFACGCFLLAISSVALIAQEPLNNEAILKLVKAGIGEETIVGMVNQQPGKYALAEADISALKDAGVSEKIIAAMIVKGTTTSGVSTPPNATPPASATTSNPSSPQPPLILLDSTPIRLRLNRNLSSADATVGETVDFEVLDDLVVDGLLVVPRGGTAIATVTEAQAKPGQTRPGDNRRFHRRLARCNTRGIPNHH